MTKVEEVYKRLTSWIGSLNMEVQGETSEHIRRILSGDIELPENCPSRASLIQLQIRGIEQKLEEVNAAFRDLENAIWEEGW